MKEGQKEGQKKTFRFSAMSAVSSAVILDKGQKQKASEIKGFTNFSAPSALITIIKL